MLFPLQPRVLSEGRAHPSTTLGAPRGRHVRPSPLLACHYLPKDRKENPRLRTWDLPFTPSLCVPGHSPQGLPGLGRPGHCCQALWPLLRAAPGMLSVSPGHWARASRLRGEPGSRASSRDVARHPSLIHGQSLSPREGVAGVSPPLCLTWGTGVRAGKWAETLPMDRW